MSRAENDETLYVLEHAAYTEFLKKGVERIDDIDLIVLHAFLARCEPAMDKDRRLIRELEYELFFRLKQRRVKGLYHRPDLKSRRN